MRKVLLGFIILFLVFAGFYIFVYNLFPLSKSFSSEDKTGSLILLATGDIMVHERQLQSAYRPDKGHYCFDEWFTQIKPYLQEGDLVVGNLETTLAGEEMKYTGYPLFNSPESLAGSLKEAGFDILTTANNHCLDRGEDGVRRTIEHIEKAGLNFSGTARSRKERDNFYSVNINGVRIIFIAYTFGTNGIALSEGKEYMVNILEENQIRNDIKRASDTADLVVVSLHWGQEYNRDPHPSQQKLAEDIIFWGADLILGSHPHVLQPVEFIRTDSGREGVVVYSLGNFISNQTLPFTDSGIIVRLHYTKDKEQVVLNEITCIPTWVHRFYLEGRPAYRVLPVADALYLFENNQDDDLNADDYLRMKEVWEETTGHIWLTPYIKKERWIK